MTIKITDWVGATPDTVTPLKTYTVAIRRADYFTICDILNRITYVYTKSLPVSGNTHEISYPY